MARSNTVEARLLVATGCPHCDAVLKAAGRLIKEGAIAVLTVTNITQRPQVAEEVGIRSVPWLAIAGVEFSGAVSYSELKSWLQQLKEPDGMARYIGHLFQTGELNQVLHMVRNDPPRLHDMAKLLFVERTKMVERIGIGAVLEDLTGEAVLEKLLPELTRLAHSKEHKDRVDAAYYLGLTRSGEARKILEAMCDDDHFEVKQEAVEALEEITDEGD